MQALHPTFTEHVPTLVELALVPRDVVIPRMQRPMRRRVGNVEKERLVLRLIRDEFDGVGRDRVGVIERRVERFVLGVLLTASQRSGLEERSTAGQRPEKAIEAA